MEIAASGKRFLETALAKRLIDVKNRPQRGLAFEAVCPRTMSRKRVKYRWSWTLSDENIENVERVTLDPEVQRQLGCSLGEHVFPEYPWAFVSRDAVLSVANVTGSSLEPHRDKIEAYRDDNLLVGYASTQLIARDFVICLTEDARLAIARRNADISKGIRREVAGRIRRPAGPWKSLGSESELDEERVRNARELYEVEVRLPVELLGLNRNLCDRSSGDSRDGYVELIPYENFENVRKRRVSRTTQTHLNPRDAEVQTYPGHPKNAWTQYAYEDILGPQVDNDESAEEGKESTEEKSEKSEGRRETGGSGSAKTEIEAQRKPAEKSPLQLFLEARAQEMTNAVSYNVVMNVYVDDVDMLARPSSEIAQPSADIICVERSSLVYLHLTAGKVVSDACWHPNLADYVVVSYVSVPLATGYDISESTTESTVLLWSLSDSLRPRLSLQCHRDVYCVSFCPTNGDFIVGGSASGQVIVWNIHGWMGDRDHPEDDRTDHLDPQSRDIVPIVPMIVISDRDHSHELVIRRIQWLPDNHRLEPSGKLTKLSTSSSCQFMTISEDGTVAVWDLLKYSITSQLKSSDRKGLDDAFRPIYRLDLRPTRDSFFTPLYLCLPSASTFREDDKRHGELDSAEMDYMRRLWISTAQGHFTCCSWEGQMFDTEASGLEQCKIPDGFFAHDGPVVAILRSPHLEDVLLTVGGRVFAIWKDDYLDMPLLRRRSDCVYTAGCWTNRPGVFMMGTGQGNLEVWDIRRKANEPVLSLTISRKPITRLSLQDSRGRHLKLIGAGDCGSVFHIFEEMMDPDDTLERMDWFEEYVWREVRRKKVFSAWQKDFLQTDQTAIARRQMRAEEERKSRLEATRLKLYREQEERLRMRAEEEARKAPKSKEVKWKLRQQERMQRALLEKKKLAPRELEKKRQPLVSLAEEKNVKMTRARDEAALQDRHFEHFMSVQLPEYSYLKRESRSSEGDAQRDEVEPSEEEVQEYLQRFHEFEKQVRTMLAEKSYIPEFNWKTFMKIAKERMESSTGDS